MEPKLKLKENQPFEVDLEQMYVNMYMFISINEGMYVCKSICVCVCFLILWITDCIAVHAAGLAVCAGPRNQE